MSEFVGFSGSGISVQLSRTRVSSGWGWVGLILPGSRPGTAGAAAYAAWERTRAAGSQC